MKKIINYEKDIQFKTTIGEISTISLEHDFTVDDGLLKGEFILNGEYKTNSLCINKESFDYHLPLEYELERNVDIDTLSYDIENFEYNIKGDNLSVIIDFGVRYEEKKIEPTIPEITESELNLDLDDVDDFENIDLTNNLENNSDIEEKNDIPELTREVKLDSMSEQKTHLEEKNEEELIENRMDNMDQDIILNSMMESDEYITYHVHIVKEGETLEMIAAEYKTSVDVIKEYNNIETLEIKSKLIIPDSMDE